MQQALMKHKFSLAVMSMTSDQQWCCLFLVQKFTSRSTYNATFTIDVTSFIEFLLSKSS